MELQGQSIIGYARSSNTGNALNAFNPATGEALAPIFYSASKDEAQHAIRLAAESFASYAALAPTGRAAFLRTIAQNLDALGEALVERADAASLGVLMPLTALPSRVPPRLPCSLTSHRLQNGTACKPRGARKSDL